MARACSPAYDSPYPHSREPNCQVPSPIAEIFVAGADAQVTHASILRRAYPSRSAALRILPEGPLGSSAMNRISRGYLYAASRSRQ